MQCNGMKKDYDRIIKDKQRWADLIKLQRMMPGGLTAKRALECQADLKELSRLRMAIESEIYRNHPVNRIDRDAIESFRMRNMVMQCDGPKKIEIKRKRHLFLSARRNIGDQSQQNPSAAPDTANNSVDQQPPAPNSLEKPADNCYDFSAFEEVLKKPKELCFDFSAIKESLE